MIWNDQLKSPYNSRFMANSGKSINLKTCDDQFLFIENGFLQHVARGINSSIIIVNVRIVNGNQDNDFDELC